MKTTPKDVTDFEKAISDDIFKTMSDPELVLNPDAGPEIITNTLQEFIDEHPEKMAELSALFDKHWAEGTLQELLDSQPEQFEKRKDENFNVSDHINVTVDWTPAAGEEIKEDFINCVKGLTNG